MRKEPRFLSGVSEGAPDHKVTVLYEHWQVRGVAAEPLQMAPDSMMRGGLGGNKEFEGAEIEARSAG